MTAVTDYKLGTKVKILKTAYDMDVSEDDPMRMEGQIGTVTGHDWVGTPVALLYVHLDNRGGPGDDAPGWAFYLDEVTHHEG